MNDTTPLFVTRPSLPPLPELIPMLEEIWDSRMLTNFSHFHEKFVEALCGYLGVEHLTLVANATLGLMISARHLGLTGEVITTPFSFVATGHALLWSGVTPVFVDIDPVSMNIDPAQIERAITPKTTAIMGVHCYGQPCDVEAIQGIADRHGLKVIYDAAHAFGVRHKEKSVLLHGNLSVLSFHATKVFNTFEGGAIVSRNAESKRELDRLINYGIVDETTIEGIGFNAKMNEFNAALGLLQLQYVDSYMDKRGAVDRRYRKLLSGIQGIECVYSVDIQPKNYYAFPILIGPEYGLSRDDLYLKFRAANIYSKKYFFPLLSELPMYRDLPSAGRNRLPAAHDVASRVLCLPMYPGLTPEDQDQVVAIILQGTSVPSSRAA